jgi:putative membrane protein
MMSRTRLIQILAAGFVLLWVVLALSPFDRSDWLLENVLTAVGVGVLVATRRVLPLSNASYVSICGFLCLHTIGAHYTYSLVPYDEAFRAVTGHPLDGSSEGARNHYDRFVHFAYGSLLVLPLREFMMLHAGVRGFWSYFLPIDIVLSTSALYELIEWGAAVFFGGDLGAAFLGTQGDGWDAHKDIALGGLGGLVATLVIWATHRATGRDRTLDRLHRAGAPPEADPAVSR